MRRSATNEFYPVTPQASMFSRNVQIVPDKSENGTRFIFHRLAAGGAVVAVEGGWLPAQVQYPPVSQGQAQVCGFHHSAILGAWVLCVSQSLASALGSSPLLSSLLLPPSASKGER
ncbi:hypothetical protein HX867_09265 [Pseudomonas gingeri]|uniref:hypothetical protein n=1 Tax=Pseudomonas gingeri TaxID=117681 RepID=UPI0015A49323|nr:hypothetical protein [Pseudomonas gingeri]NVZ62267.1 hypothetical protein [Pseudomonas gingeri]NVZ76240.1 hypothetical protein [Pseudomonas gingeri]